MISSSSHHRQILHFLRPATSVSKFIMNSLPFSNDIKLTSPPLPRSAGPSSPMHGFRSHHVSGLVQRLLTISCFILLTITLLVWTFDVPTPAVPRFRSCPGSASSVSDPSTYDSSSYHHVPGQHSTGADSHRRKAYVKEAARNCSRVAEGQKQELSRVFGEILYGVRNVALISYPEHENKGDSAIWVAQNMLLASMGIRVVYSCGVADYDETRLNQTVEAYGGGTFAILFSGGGNLGDLYGTEQYLKLRIMGSHPEVRTHILPQSLKFFTEEGISAMQATFAAMKQVTLAVRDRTSYDFAMKHFQHPNMRIDLTPDVVFFMGFRPDLRKQFAGSKKDLLFFRRIDTEGTGWEWAGANTDPSFPDVFVDTLQSDRQLQTNVGDWGYDFGLEAVDYDPAQGTHIEFRAWKRFMMGAGWLSSAEFIILDRLHGHIVSLVLGIPHVIIDNSIGKLGDYHSTWTKDCPLGHLVDGPNTADDVRDAYQFWTDHGKFSGADFVEMV